MLRPCVYVLFVCNVAIILVVLPRVTRGSDELQNKISVNAADIGKKVQIIGRLGKPMGTLMSLRGQWCMPSKSPKPASLEFHVTHLDGKPLPGDVVFYRQVVTATNLKNQTEHEAEGVVWEMRAFEEGRFVNLKERHWEEFYGAPVSPLDYGQGPFACFLTGNVTKENRPRR